LLLGLLLLRGVCVRGVALLIMNELHVSSHLVTAAHLALQLRYLLRIKVLAAEVLGSLA
jgi:hypothetical protein